MADLLRVEIANKYTVILPEDGSLHALRYGEEWRDLCGDGLVCAMAYEIDSLRQQRTDLLAACEAAVDELDHYPILRQNVIEQMRAAIAKAKL